MTVFFILTQFPHTTQAGNAAARNLQNHWDKIKPPAQWPAEKLFLFLFD